MQCMSVDLPEPDGPITAVKHPRSRLTETSSRATTRVSPRPYALEMRSARAAVAWAAGPGGPPYMLGAVLVTEGLLVLVAVSRTTLGVRRQPHLGPRDRPHVHLRGERGH